MPAIKLQGGDLPGGEPTPQPADAFDVTRTLPRPPALEATVFLKPPPALGLPHIAVDKAGQGLGDICVQGTLGRGGMADVFIATQRALERTVAVKALKTGERRPEVITALVREGRITGALEHPNIVPVHALGIDDDGRPLLVMKHIEGDLWLDLIAHPDRELPAWAPEDRLQLHLEVLMQVCNAAHFAHSHGVVHRDLKPSNIMIGSFGEVYVLDWGIAVRPGAAEQADNACIVGSPAYMAPEMLSGEVGAVSAATDVYLLGAILYRILSGEVLHRGATLDEVFHAIAERDTVALPDDVPEELAGVCRRALEALPERRFESAEQLRKAVAAFLAHRSSIALTEVAAHRLAQVRALPGDSPDQGDDLERYRVLGECRFGFAQALSTWRENPRALAGHDEALRLLVGLELGRGQLLAAARLLEELHSPAPELEDQVRGAWLRMQQEHAHLERLRRLAAELDPDVGRRHRGLFAASVGVVSCVGPVLIGVFDRNGTLPMTHSVSLVSSGGMLVATGSLLLLFKQALLSNAANRRLMAAVVIASVGFALNRVRAALAEVSPHEAAGVDLLIFSIIAALVGATVDRRVAVAAPVCLSMACLATLWPSYAFDISGVSNLVAIGLVAWRWWRPGGDGPPMATAAV